MNGDSLVDDELRDIQGYQSIIIPDYLWWILITLFVFLVGFLIYKFFLSKKKEVVLTVYEKTIQDLDSLDTQSLSKEFYLTYSDIVRNYLLERIELNLFDKTLNELRAMLDKHDVIDIQSKNQLLNIFARADMAKFAKQNVSPEKRLEHLEKTKEILEKVEFKLEGGKDEQTSPIDLEEVEA
jgi:hypothetical protein